VSKPPQPALGHNHSAEHIVTGTDPAYRTLSLWHETTPTDWTPRPALDGEVDVDVAVVGAGYTGLWTAYYLSQADPGLRIVVVESEVAGFGASGRNGGWCSALFPTSLGEAQDAAMRASVDEVHRVTQAEGIDCHFAKGGTIVLARSRAQLARARSEYGDQVLSAAEAGHRLRATRTLGATYTPDCAAIHPGRLVRGLADVVIRRGVVLHERTPALSIEPGVVHTPRGSVRAPYVVRATEGFTPRLPGYARAVVPVYSLIIATEPLAPHVWDEIGLAQRETFSDHRHLIIYGQRTADDRLVFGGRGAPYHLRSRISPAFDRDHRVFAGLHATLLDLFPVLAGTRFTHAWGGPLGIPRDWCASVGLDRGSGLAWAGGYVGDGVSTTNLAGRTLADLILDRSTELTTLPWVGHRSPRWEPEPLRWLGINAGLRAMTLADAEERLTGRPSLVGRVMAPLVGGHSA
jgi:glycine/D-amino acid oxidase-like deaminating enzyme